MFNEKSEQFWNAKWLNKQTGWDIGYASPAISHFMEQYENKKASILIPGCGNAYEAELLAGLGYKNITLLDISEALVNKLQDKYKNNSSIQVILGDFFTQQGEYDLIIEQTFFCAIQPSLRKDYVHKVKELLTCNGRLIGLLFNRTFVSNEPPYGGNIEEYKKLFEGFEIVKMETCYNSIPPREGTELFINMLKKC